MIIKDSQGEYTPAPAGTHVSRCISVTDIGTQYSDLYKRDSRRVMLAWELCNEQTERDGKQFPVIISKEYTASLNKKADLRKHLEAWRGKPFTEDELEGFDLKNILGAPCMLNIIHTQNGEGKVRAKIAAVSSMPKGMSAPAPTLDLINYNIDQGQDETFKKLPEWVQKKIAECSEWNSGGGNGHHVTEPESPVGDGEEDPVPF